MTKKKVKEKVPDQYQLRDQMVTHIKVIDNGSHYTIREGDGKQYGDGGETGCSHQIVGIEVVDKDQYCHIAVPFDVKEEVKYYLLWANYDTGDSFGSSRGYADWIDLYQSEAVAEENAERCNESKEYSVILSLDDGRRYTRHVPWQGYFEHLNFIEILPVTVEKKAKRYTR